MKKMLPLLLFIFPLLVIAQQSDNLNGTFTNPVLWADFPDPDAIRVGDTYYMVSTSMHYFPGVTVLASNDLVNWHIASNAVEEFKAHPYYDMNGGSRYAGGPWASSIRYYNNKYYILFNTNAEGGFMCIADSPRGPWKLQKLSQGYYDPGLFIDSDNRMYVIHGHTQIYVTELNPVDLTVKKPAILIYTGTKSGLEGNHCYKIGNYYYIFCTYGTAQGTQICLRSKNIYGPYEEKVVLDDYANLFNMKLHQGCLFDTPAGDHWSLIFQDRQALGRIPFLLPVTWKDDWPLLAYNTNGLVTFPKPLASSTIITFPTSDEFNSNKLSLQWQFNHNPDKEKYSLSEHSGYIRLKTATVTDKLKSARNTVCQRIFGPCSEATVSIDLSGMIEGDEAGLCVLEDPHASVLIHKNMDKLYVQMKVKDKIVESKEYDQLIVYLRCVVNGITDRAYFFFSDNNIDFTSIGTEFKMEFNLSDFCGNRFGLFNYANDKLGGYIDVDWFRVVGKNKAINYHVATEQIEVEMYDNIKVGSVVSSPERNLYKNQDVIFKSSGWISFNQLDVFSSNLSQFSMRYMVRESGAKLCIRENSVDGPIIANFNLPKATVRTTFSEKINVPLSIGIHKLYFIFEKSGSQNLQIDWLKFSEASSGNLTETFSQEPKLTLQGNELLIESDFIINSLSIYNISGMKCVNETSSASRINISQLPKGVYIARINGQLNIKFIYQ